MNRSHISYTQLNMYQRCGKQYEFRYINDVKEPPALRPGAGKAGHAGIEAHMRDKMRTGEDPAVELMIDSFATSWTEQMIDVELQPEEDESKTKDSMVYTLAHYHATRAKDIQPKAVERDFLLKIELIDQTLPPIKGYIDLIDSPTDQPDQLQIEDTKFKFPDKRGVARHMSQTDVDWSDQLTIYDAAIQAAHIVVSNVGLTSIKPPKFKPNDPVPVEPPDILPLWRDPRLMRPEIRQQMIERFMIKMEAIVRAIDAGHFIPTNDPRTCSWCGYRKLCPDSLAKDDFIAQYIREEIAV